MLGICVPTGSFGSSSTTQHCLGHSFFV